MKRINVGCGKEPTKGWQNYDDSMPMHLAKAPFLFHILKKAGALDQAQVEFVLAVIQYKIKCADARKYIPEPDHSVDVLYSSHMIEHLDRDDVKLFLKEARRVLIDGGIIRIVVPDIRILVDQYLDNKDADAFIEATLLPSKTPRTLFQRVKYLMVGNRLHKWMYDGESLCKLLLSQGFKNVQSMKAGITTIPDPGELNLFERSVNSVYVEAVNHF